MPIYFVSDIPTPVPIVTSYLSSMVYFEKSSYIKMPVFLSLFTLFKIRCLSLNLQTMVRGRFWFWPVFVLRGPILWHLSILTSLSIPNDSLDFFSHASHVSLGCFFILSIRRLFLRDLSSNSINFADIWSSSVALTCF